MQFSAIRTRAAVRFGDSGLAIVTDATWKDYVNEAYREVCALEHWPGEEAASTSVSVTASTRSASLPTDVNQVLMVYNSTDNIRMVPITDPRQAFDEFPEQDETGTPRLYRIRAGLVEVYPLPEATTTLHVHYMVYPGDMSADSDTPAAFPTIYHHVLIPLAVAKAYRDDGNFQAAQSYESEAGVILEAMRRDLIGTPRTDAYPGIVDNFF